MERGKTGALGARAFVGMLWNLGSMVATRASGVAAQVVLGWTLPKEAFGLFGLAVLIIGFGQAVHNGGIRPVLMQQPGDFPRLVSAGLRYSTLVALATMVVLGATAPGLEILLERPGLATILCIGAVSFPLQVPPLIYQAKLAVELRFRTSAAVMVAAGLVRSGTMIAASLAGMGASSFVSHYPVTAAFEWLISRRAAKRLPRGARLDFSLFVWFFRSGRWLVLGTLGSTLALHGEKLLIDRFSPSLLGTYFFGSQLVLGITNLLQAGFANVLLPTFASMGDDRRRQAAAYLRALRIFTLFSAPACICLALASPALVHLAWAGKWDDAIPVVQSIFLVLVSWLLGQLSLQLVSAAGRWRLQAFLVSLDALTSMLAAAVGASTGSLVALAAFVSGQRLLWGLVQVAATARVLGIDLLRAGGAIIAPAGAALAAAVIAAILAARIAGNEFALSYLSAVVAVYVSSFAAIVSIFFRADLRELVQLVRPRAM